LLFSDVALGIGAEILLACLLARQKIGSAKPDPCGNAPIINC